ncbi:hypothetical protein HDU96_009203 [Phlyctochytrium bullatum]|nr:hypothetical protein HDU96_009203 [Phlyctochytrium bullatum]
MAARAQLKDETKAGTTVVDVVDDTTSSNELSSAPAIGDGAFVSEAKLFGNLTVEVAGIERVPEDARKDTNIFSNLTLWLSANTVVSTFALGTLGPNVFGMGFYDSFFTILLFNLIGVLPVSYFSTFGPKFGLRQMVFTRLSFGYYGGMFVSLLNIIACIGWAAVNAIVGAQLLQYVSNNTIPVWAGIIILGFVTTIVVLFGYNYVHAYERWAFIPMAIIFIIIMSQAGSKVVLIPWKGTGVEELSSIMAFGGAIFGYATGWSAFAADYNVNQPANTPSWKVFLLTFCGCFIPQFCIEMLGMSVATTLTLNPDTKEAYVPAYKAGYATADVGGLVGAVLDPLGGFGKFLVVILSLSTIANNIPNNYSLALSVQVFGKAFKRINRVWWVLIGAVLYVAIAQGIWQNFSKNFGDFLHGLGYWLAPWIAITTIDHLVFHNSPTSQYDPTTWDAPKLLPVGWAAVLSLFVGFVGAILGMAQVFYTGPIAKPLGTFGTDLGLVLAFVFAAVAYLVLRPIEKKVHGR